MNEIAGGVEREIAWLMQRLLGENVNQALAANHLMRDVYLPWLERRWVHRARRSGMTWTAIGRVLGRSRQAVQQHYDRPVSVADVLPPVLPRSWSDVDAKERQEVSAGIRRLAQLRDAEATGEIIPW